MCLVPYLCHATSERTEQCIHCFSDRLVLADSEATRRACVRLCLFLPFLWLWFPFMIIRFLDDSSFIICAIFNSASRSNPAIPPFIIHSTNKLRCTALPWSYRPAPDAVSALGLRTSRPTNRSSQEYILQFAAFPFGDSRLYWARLVWIPRPSVFDLSGRRATVGWCVCPSSLGWVVKGISVSFVSFRSIICFFYSFPSFSCFLSFGSVRRSIDRRSVGGTSQSSRILGLALLLAYWVWPSSLRWVTRPYCPFMIASGGVNWLPRFVGWSVLAGQSILMIRMERGRDSRTLGLESFYRLFTCLG